MNKHVFNANGKNYELVLTKDCFGCEGVAIYEDNCYKGIIDTADDNDFLKIEYKIVMDPHFVDSFEIFV